MIGVAVAGGVAVGSALAFLLRPQRSLQLAALLLMSLAAGVAMATAGAVIPGIVVVLVGGIGTTALLSPLSQIATSGDRRDRAARRVSTIYAGVAGLGVFALLLGVGIATRSAFSAASSGPSPAQVGSAFLLGAGIPALGAVVLLATVLVTAVVLIQRDRREALEEQAEAARRRRIAQQRRRAEQRE
ncbi:MAG: hypothetical protein WBU92_05280, partial [Candidatus Dormiibacterota bacterium]